MENENNNLTENSALYKADVSCRSISSIMPKWTMKWILFRIGKGKRWFWG